MTILKNICPLCGYLNSHSKNCKGQLIQKKIQLKVSKKPRIEIDEDEDFILMNNESNKSIIEAVLKDGILEIGK